MENEFTSALNKKFMNPAKFAVEIEKLVKNEKLKCDAQQLNFMKKTTRAKLPL